LLEAGLALLREEPTEHLFEVMSARRVIAKASSSTGAFYHHFDGPDSYVDQLLTYSLEQTPVPEHVESSLAFESTLESGAGFDAAILAGGAAALRFADNDITVGLQLLVRAKSSRDPGAKERVRRMYELVNGFLSAYYDTVLERSGRELRPPYSMRDVVTALTALY
jgi:AcrR family transcriptional regulator